ncbi:MAG: glycosyltransferase family 2 protein [Deltaproteobacteria bacterium]|nr:glycosyltransferase family 2 protein [Deltaproteobacteria bacterium]
MDGFSVIVPAYNEEKGIGPVLAGLVRVLSDFDKPYEIIVVNDGSTDMTKEEAGTVEGPIRIVDNNRNMGYGASLKKGIMHSIYDLIVISDADGTYPIDKIPELVTMAETEKRHMVVGARTGPGIKIPLCRRLVKWLLTRLANYLTGIKIPDINSGLRVIQKTVLEEFERILPEGFSFTSTITIAMLLNGYSVKYVPIDYFERKGKSKIRPIQDTLGFLQLIIRAALYFNPLKIFIPLSFLLVLLSFIVLIGSWLLFGKPMDVTFGVILMTAAIILAIGMLADLIDKRLP